MSLFIKVAKLAKAAPELRPFLMPLLREAAEKPTYKDYVEKKKKDGEKPMDQDAWEAKVFGKGKEEGEGGKGSKQPKGTVLKKFKAKMEDISEEIQSARVRTRIAEEKRIELVSDIYLKAGGDSVYAPDVEKKDGSLFITGPALRGKDISVKLSDSEALKYKKYEEELEEAAKEVTTGLAAFRGFQKLKPLIEHVGDELGAFIGSKPTKGKKLSDAELMQKFLANAKPETKERMKGMSPAEFKEMMAAIMDEEE